MTQLKPIRFNMQFNYDGQIVPIRSMEDLKSKMNINDLYEYFSEGILARWLDVHGEKEKAQQIQEISPKGNKPKTIERIFEILKIGFNERDICDAINSYLFHEDILVKKKKLETMLEKTQKAIISEIDSYNELKKEIIEANNQLKDDVLAFNNKVKEISQANKNKTTDIIKSVKEHIQALEEKCKSKNKSLMECIEEDENNEIGFLEKSYIKVVDGFSKVKTATWEVLENYTALFSMDYMFFYDIMMRDCPLAVFVALMRKTGRNYFLPPVSDEDMKNSLPSEQLFRERLKKISKCESISQKIIFYINGRCLDESLQYIFNNDGLLCFVKEPDYESGKDGWQDVVSKGHRVMILHCGNKIEIRPPKDNNNQRKGQEVSPYEIMNGFDFRVLDPTHFNNKEKEYILLYMEID